MNVTPLMRRALDLANEGKPPMEIAAVIGCSAASASELLKRCKQAGLTVPAFKKLTLDERERSPSAWGKLPRNGNPRCKTCSLQLQDNGSCIDCPGTREAIIKALGRQNGSHVLPEGAPKMGRVPYPKWLADRDKPGQHDSIHNSEV